MGSVVRLGIILALVCAVSAGTLTAVFSVVSPRIEENRRIEAERKRQEVVPDAAFEELTLGGRPVHVGRDASGAAVGTVVTEAPRGYAGPIGMTIGIAPDGKVLGLAISKLDQTETPGLGVKITLPAFRDQFRGLELERVNLRSDGGEIDAITAATISSRAVVIGVRAGLEWYRAALPDGPPPSTSPAAEDGAAGAAAGEAGN